MKKSLLIIPLSGLFTYVQASYDNATGRLLHKIEDSCVLRRAETMRAVSDHPILDLFLTSIRDENDTSSSQSKSGDYLDVYIAASERLDRFTQQLDEALTGSDTQRLERLLTSASSFRDMEYEHRKLLWIMMPQSMLNRLRAVKDWSVQARLKEIFKSPAIALFAAE